MTQQLDLLRSGAPRFPRARREDPSSSHAAAARIERTGAAARQMDDVLAAVRRWPGRTSMELAADSGIDRYAIARRASELARLGVIKRAEPDGAAVPCSVSGKRALRWHP